LPTSNDREVIEAVDSTDNANDFIVFTASTLTSSEGGVYRTTDGGANFTRATGLPIGYDPGAEFYWNVSLERDATDTSIRYALLRNNGFWKSMARGASWTKPATQPGNNFGRLRVDPVSGRVWVGHVIGLEYSPNKGATWTPVTGLTSVSELDAYNGRIAVIGRMSGDDADHIYYSADNGGTWDEITRPGQRFANAEAVAVDPWRVGTVWISTGGRSISRFTPGAALQLNSAVSRKRHGLVLFDVSLPLSGEPGVECRGTDGNYELVFEFDNNVVSGNASVISGTGNVAGTTFSEHTMAVNLRSVANAQQITVKLSGVTDTQAQVLADTMVSMNVLVGDSTGNKSVNASDVSQIKAQSGGNVTAANFRTDLNANGSINASDVSLAKSHSGMSVP
jgi:hypothetical protein